MIETPRKAFRPGDEIVLRRMVFPPVYFVADLDTSAAALYGGFPSGSEAYEGFGQHDQQSIVMKNSVQPPRLDTFSHEVILLWKMVGSGRNIVQQISAWSHGCFRVSWPLDRRLLGFRAPKRLSREVLVSTAGSGYNTTRQLDAGSNDRLTRYHTQRPGLSSYG